MEFDPELDAEGNAYGVTFFIVQAAKASLGTVIRRTREHPWWTYKLERLKKRKKKVYRANSTP